MEKTKLVQALTEISTNLKKEYTSQGKKFTHIPSELPYKLLKKLARAKAYAAESYHPGTLGKSPVSTILSRKERREGVAFVPMYNGDLYRLVRKEEFNEKKQKNVVKEIYELIEG